MAKPGGELNASGHERSAGGLGDHFTHNKSHQKVLPNDGYHLPTKFDLSTRHTGVYKGPVLHQASANVLNEMLTKNQLDNHVYFTEEGGFHNHRAHHLLAAYALGATPQHLKLAHDTMENTQRSRFSIDESRVKDMYDVKKFKTMLGDDRYFHDYLAFFWQKFEQDGWRQVVTEYLFSGTDLADDLFVRLFAGIWHNLILIGYGIEFEQPGIIAEGLAGACVHSDAFGPYLLKCERLAKNSSEPGKPLLHLLQEIRDDPALCDKEHWKGGTSFSYDDNEASNAPPGMAELAAQYKIERAEDLPYRTIELININAFLAGASQRPEKAVKIDFIFIHHINASIFFSAFLEQDWISSAVKIRLLEWYARMNLLFYAASLGPPLRTNEVLNYKPCVSGSTWDSIIQRGLALPDDGHLVKMIRALAHGQQESRPWEETEKAASLPVRGDMWLQIANMAVDSAEAETDIIKRWLRGAGSDEAWAVVPSR